MEREDIAAAIEQLPENLRVPIVLHYQEGLKYREIAEALGCPEGTVAKRIATAKERLRTTLKGSGALAAIPVLEDGLRAQPDIPVPASLAGQLHELVTQHAVATASAGATGSATASNVSRFVMYGGLIVLGVAIIGGLAFWNPDAGDPEPTVAEGPSDANTGQGSGGAATPGDGRVPADEDADATRADAATEIANTTPATGEQPAGAELPRVRGHIRDESGRPLAGAQVSLLQLNYSDPVEIETVSTDEAGYYEIFQPARKPGKPGQVEEDSTSDGSVAAPRGRRMLSGGNIVTADGGLISVVNEHEDGEDGSTETTTTTTTNKKKSKDDEKPAARRGRAFGAPMNMQPRYRIRASYENHVQAYSEYRALPDEGTETIDLTLHECRSLSGVVLDPEGNLLPDAEVTIVGRSGAASDHEYERSTTTDAGGRFQLTHLDAGQYLLTAARAGFNDGSAVASTGETDVELQLTLAGSVHVHLKAGRGAGEVRGAEVRLWRGDQFIAYGLTDNQGDAYIDDVVPGPVTVYAYRASLPLAERTLQVRPGQQARAELALGDGLSIVGQVIAADDEVDLEQYSVRALWQDRTQHQYWQDVTVDEDGHFTVPHLPEGRYQLATFHAGSRWQKQLEALTEVQLDAKSARHTVQVRPADTHYGELRVEVSDDTGEPIENAFVSVMSDPGRFFLGSAPTDDQGVVDLELPIIGGAEVTVYSQGMAVAQARVELAPRAGARLTMAPIQEREDLDVASYFPEGTTFKLHDKLSVRALLSWLALASEGRVVIDAALSADPQLEARTFGPMPFSMPARTMLEMLERMQRLALEPRGDRLHLSRPAAEPDGARPR